MPSRSRAPFVALTALLSRRFPDLGDPTAHVVSGQVLVDGAVVSNPRARVRSDASVKLKEHAGLRGTVKLAHVISELSLDLSGKVAVDVGAAAGGFTQALLDTGCSRVYAVDTGFGQLRGHLRSDSRVVALERTNLGSLDEGLVPDVVDVVTVDLSYLSLADAAPQLGQLRLGSGVELLALVKPTYELHASTLAASKEDLLAAVAAAKAALAEEGWRVAATVASPIGGASGAVEEFVYATRRKLFQPRR
jgi:23S rRNA (cytidine1920-2'-O)/16S rRNA (cytidine1409-2'-O)-methyltransferase